MTKPVILFMMDSNRNKNEPIPDFQSLPDEEICLLAGAGNAAAEEELVRRYGRLVRACARPLFLAGGDSEDLFQEGMLGLLTAIRSFEGGRDASFRTFAEICIRHSNPLFLTEPMRTCFPAKRARKMSSLAGRN